MMKKNPLRIRVKQIFNGLMEDVFYIDSRNIERARQRQALQQTVEFIDKFLPSVRSFNNRYDLFEHISRFVPNDEPGLICEFGVAGGKSINFIGRIFPKRTLHGFDSFEGLPEDWGPMLPKGAFKQEIPDVISNIRLHKGWFSDSIPPFLSEHKGNADFLHIDCDLYSSTKTVLDLFASRIRRGTVICFDEYFNYAGWQDGEFRAFDELVKRDSLKFEYLGYNNRGTQLAVQIK